jgi:iron complex transport system permease protein
MKIGKRSFFIVNFLLVIFAGLIALSVGPAKIDGFFSQLIQPGSDEILWQIRFPRVIAALIVGAALGVAGLMAQGASNNALAEPSILGTASGAALGAVTAILLGLAQVGSIAAITSGVIGALLATTLTLKIASLRGNLSSFALIIVGIAVSATLTALVGLASAMITQPDARSISFWNFGSLALITYENLAGVIATTFIGILIAWRVAPNLDRLSLGDETAFHLGVDVSKTRWLALVALSLLAGGAVSTVGIIAFIGLAAPHIARFIYGPKHRPLVIESALIGSLILVVADTLARTLAAPNELSIGLITSLVGAPILVALVTFKNNVWRVQ